jgi:hypothetical protein
MTFEELREHYGTGYKFSKETGMSASSWRNWKKWGYIPIESQLKIQKMTQGKLKVNQGYIAQFQTY